MEPVNLKLESVHIKMELSQYKMEPVHFQTTNLIPVE